MVGQDGLAGFLNDVGQAVGRFTGRFDGISDDQFDNAAPKHETALGQNVVAAVDGHRQQGHPFVERRGKTALLESADATAVCTFVTEKNSTETSDTSAGTLVDATYSILEFYWDGSTYIHAYFDGTLVASSSTNLPNDESLTFSLELLTGEGNTNTCTIDWIHIIQVN